ncbi:AP2 domain transcription factor AP2XII-4 [Toxoplasma gondii MAS]|uniref:AP2 domain transcription factor AP2XII-4 n=2 Tax=Toxoplasma gondii TaxID=5811 RepID=A0A086QTX4_TOXGO|nr:AP2 domain transcription factor AP2XII-4 [Toxoplasma gondii MAS]PUA90634.1 AP2 domain transcription factor AP2XII-4 [Toxoplasma gondii TgCATBr9]
MAFAPRTSPRLSAGAGGPSEASRGGTAAGAPLGPVETPTGREPSSPFLRSASAKRVTRARAGFLASSPDNQSRSTSPLRPADALRISEASSASAPGVRRSLRASNARPPVSASRGLMGKAGEEGEGASGGGRPGGARRTSGGGEDVCASPRDISYRDKGAGGDATASSNSQSPSSVDAAVSSSYSVASSVSSPPASSLSSALSSSFSSSTLCRSGSSVCPRATSAVSATLQQGERSQESSLLAGERETDRDASRPQRETDEGQGAKSETDRAPEDDRGRSRRGSASPVQGPFSPRGFFSNAVTKENSAYPATSGQSGQEVGCRPNSTLSSVSVCSLSSHPPSTLASDQLLSVPNGDASTVSTSSPSLSCSCSSFSSSSSSLSSSSLLSSSPLSSTPSSFFSSSSSSSSSASVAPPGEGKGRPPVRSGRGACPRKPAGPPPRLCVPYQCQFNVEKREWRARYLFRGQKKMRVFSLARYSPEVAVSLAELFLTFLADNDGIPRSEVIAYWAETLARGPVTATTGTNPKGGNPLGPGASEEETVGGEGGEDAESRAAEKEREEEGKASSSSGSSDQNITRVESSEAKEDGEENSASSKPPGAASAATEPAGGDADGRPGRAASGPGDACRSVTSTETEGAVAVAPEAKGGPSSDVSCTLDKSRESRGNGVAGKRENPAWAVSPSSFAAFVETAKARQWVTEASRLQAASLPPLAPAERPARPPILPTLASSRARRCTSHSLISGLSAREGSQRTVSQGDSLSPASGVAGEPGTVREAEGREAIAVDDETGGEHRGFPHSQGPAGRGRLSGARPSSSDMRGEKRGRRALQEGESKRPCRRREDLKSEEGQRERRRRDSAWPTGRREASHGRQDSRVKEETPAPDAGAALALDGRAAAARDRPQKAPSPFGTPEALSSSLTGSGLHPDGRNPHGHPALRVKLAAGRGNGLLAASPASPSSASHASSLASPSASWHAAQGEAEIPGASTGFVDSPCSANGSLDDSGLGGPAAALQKSWRDRKRSRKKLSKSMHRKSLASLGMRAPPQNACLADPSDVGPGVQMPSDAGTVPGISPPSFGASEQKASSSALGLAFRASSSFSPKNGDVEPAGRNPPQFLPAASVQRADPPGTGAPPSQQVVSSASPCSPSALAATASPGACRGGASRNGAPQGERFSFPASPTSQYRWYAHPDGGATGPSCCRQHVGGSGGGGWPVVWLKQLEMAVNGPPKFCSYVEAVDKHLRLGGLRRPVAFLPLASRPASPTGLGGGLGAPGRALRQASEKALAAEGRQGQNEEKQVGWKSATGSKAGMFQGDSGETTSERGAEEAEGTGGGRRGILGKEEEDRNEGEGEKAATPTMGGASPAASDDALSPMKADRPAEALGTGGSAPTHADSRRAPGMPEGEKMTWPSKEQEMAEAGERDRCERSLERNAELVLKENVSMTSASDVSETAEEKGAPKKLASSPHSVESPCGRKAEKTGTLNTSEKGENTRTAEGDDPGTTIVKEEFPLLPAPETPVTVTAQDLLSPTVYTPRWQATVGKSLELGSLNCEKSCERGHWADASACDVETKDLRLPEDNKSEELKKETGVFLGVEGEQVEEEKSSKEAFSPEEREREEQKESSKAAGGGDSCRTPRQQEATPRASEECQPDSRIDMKVSPNTETMVEKLEETRVQNTEEPEKVEEKEEGGSVCRDVSIASPLESPNSRLSEKGDQSETPAGVAPPSSSALEARAGRDSALLSASLPLSPRASCPPTQSASPASRDPTPASLRVSSVASGDRNGPTGILFRPLSSPHKRVSFCLRGGAEPPQRPLSEAVPYPLNARLQEIVSRFRLLQGVSAARVSSHGKGDTSSQATPKAVQGEETVKEKATVTPTESAKSLAGGQAETEKGESPSGAEAATQKADEKEKTPDTDATQSRSTSSGFETQEAKTAPASILPAFSLPSSDRPSASCSDTHASRDAVPLASSPSSSSSPALRRCSVRSKDLVSAPVDSFSEGDSSDARPFVSVRDLAVKLYRWLEQGEGLPAAAGEPQGACGVGAKAQGREALRIDTVPFISRWRQMLERSLSIASDLRKLDLQVVHLVELTEALHIAVYICGQLRRRLREGAAPDAGAAEDLAPVDVDDPRGCSQQSGDTRDSSSPATPGGRLAGGAGGAATSPKGQAFAPRGSEGEIKPQETGNSGDSKAEGKEASGDANTSEGKRLSGEVDKTAEVETAGSEDINVERGVPGAQAETARTEMNGGVVKGQETSGDILSVGSSQVLSLSSPSLSHVASSSGKGPLKPTSSPSSSLYALSPSSSAASPFSAQLASPSSHAPLSLSFRSSSSPTSLSSPLASYPFPQTLQPTSASPSSSASARPSCASVKPLREAGDLVRAAARAALEQAQVFGVGGKLSDATHQLAARVTVAVRAAMLAKGEGGLTRGDVDLLVEETERFVREARFKAQETAAETTAVPDGGAEVVSSEAGLGLQTTNHAPVSPAAAPSAGGAFAGLTEAVEVEARQLPEASERVGRVSSPRGSLGFEAMDLAGELHLVKVLNAFHRHTECLMNERERLIQATNEDLSFLLHAMELALPSGLDTPLLSILEGDVDILPPLPPPNVEALIYLHAVSLAQADASASPSSPSAVAPCLLSPSARLLLAHFAGASPTAGGLGGDSAKGRTMSSFPGRPGEERHRADERKGSVLPVRRGRPPSSARLNALRRLHAIGEPAADAGLDTVNGRFRSKRLRAMSQEEEARRAATHASPTIPFPLSRYLHRPPRLLSPTDAGHFASSYSSPLSHPLSKGSSLTSPKRQRRSVCSEAPEHERKNLRSLFKSPSAQREEAPRSLTRTFGPLKGEGFSPASLGTLGSRRQSELGIRRRDALVAFPPAGMPYHPASPGRRLERPRVDGADMDGERRRRTRCAGDRLEERRRPLGPVYIPTKVRDPATGRVAVCACDTERGERVRKVQLFEKPHVGAFWCARYGPNDEFVRCFSIEKVGSLKALVSAVRFRQYVTGHSLGYGVGNCVPVETIRSAGRRDRNGDVAPDRPLKQAAASPPPAGVAGALGRGEVGQAQDESGETRDAVEEEGRGQEPLGSGEGASGVAAKEGHGSSRGEGEGAEGRTDSAAGSTAGDRSTEDSSRLLSEGRDAKHGSSPAGGSEALAPGGEHALAEGSEKVGRAQETEARKEDLRTSQNETHSGEDVSSLNEKALDSPRSSAPQGKSDQGREPIALRIRSTLPPSEVDKQEAAGQGGSASELASPTGVSLASPVSPFSALARSPISARASSVSPGACDRPDVSRRHSGSSDEASEALWDLGEDLGFAGDDANFPFLDSENSALLFAPPRHLMSPGSASPTGGGLGIHYDKTKHRWKATWTTLDGQRASTSFSVKVLGMERARELALEARQRALAGLDPREVRDEMVAGGAAARDRERERGRQDGRREGSERRVGFEAEAEGTEAASERLRRRGEREDGDEERRRKKTRGDELRGAEGDREERELRRRKTSEERRKGKNEAAKNEAAKNEGGKGETWKVREGGKTPLGVKSHRAKVVGQTVERRGEERRRDLRGSRREEGKNVWGQEQDAEHQVFEGVKEDDNERGRRRERRRFEERDSLRGSHGATPSDEQRQMRRQTILGSREVDGKPLSFDDTHRVDAQLGIQNEVAFPGPQGVGGAGNSLQFGREGERFASSSPVAFLRTKEEDEEIVEVFLTPEGSGSERDKASSVSASSAPRDSQPASPRLRASRLRESARLQRRLEEGEVHDRGSRPLRPEERRVAKRHVAEENVDATFSAGAGGTKKIRPHSSHDFSAEGLSKFQELLTWDCEVEIDGTDPHVWRAVAALPGPRPRPRYV